MDEYKRRRRRSRAVMSMFLDNLGGSIDNVDVATFDSDGSDLKALVVGIEPIQSGAGDPSPDNVRPISGHSSVNVIVSPTLNPLDGTITNIPLGGTYYGGQLDVLTGVLTVEWVEVDGGSLEWDGPLSNNYRTFIATPIPAAINYGVEGNDTVFVICSNYKSVAFNTSSGIDDRYVWITKEVTGNLAVKDTSKSSLTAEQFQAAMTGVQFCYKLATPQVIQLTGQQIATFLGTNNVWCDSGKIIHLEY